MKKDPRKLYVLHDAETNLYKVGSSSHPYERGRMISKAIGRHLDLEYVTPGHDYFLRKLDLPRRPHPVPHAGGGEWYDGDDEMTDFLLSIWLDPSIPARTRTA